MAKNFKIWMIGIEWKAPDQVKAIKKGRAPLAGEKEGSHHVYDIVIYEKLGEHYLQFGLETDLLPFLVQSNDRQVPLFEVERNLWIIKGEWKFGTRGKGYHLCPSVNTIGEISLILKNKDEEIIDSITVHINNSLEDFDFELLKEDFCGELWDLITTSTSEVHVSRKEKVYGSRIYRLEESEYVLQFLSWFDKIAREPKKELVHFQREVALRKVRPIPSTFRKLATAGGAHYLPSKSFREDFDNYENRFLCWMLEKIRQIVRYNLIFSRQQEQRLLAELDAIKRKIEILEKEPVVDEKEIKKEIDSQKKHYKSWVDLWEKNKNEVLRVCENKNCWKWSTIEIQYKGSMDGMEYWVNWLEETPSYGLMRFPVDMSDILEEQKRQRIRIKAFCFTSKDHSAGMWPVFLVKAIESIELVDIIYPHIIKRQEKNYNTLKQNDWKLSSILSPAEKNKMNRERSNQIGTLQKKIEKITLQIQQLRQLLSEFSDLLPIVEKRFSSRIYKSVNPRALTRFQPSMTYLQNIRYRNALRSYRDLLDTEGIDIQLFDWYDQITDYDVREMPMVFELWCLVRILKCMEEDYRFQHNKEDLNDLLKTIRPSIHKLEKHCKIRFSGTLSGREVTLHYQKRLDNGKRPDFLLEIKNGYRTINLILDAKFKNYNYRLSANYEITQMEEKYGWKDHNYVFILHPCPDKEHKDFTSRLTNLGGESIYLEGEQLAFPFHQYGYLRGIPGKTDNLKKVIGMAFEYLIEPEKNAKRDKVLDPIPTYEMFCLNCGGDTITADQKKRRSSAYHYECRCNNEDCKHEFYIDYCWNCKTRLFKHGSYWDYHRTSVWSMFDIHCPNCGMTVADRPSN